MTYSSRYIIKIIILYVPWFIYLMNATFYTRHENDFGYDRDIIHSWTDQLIQ